MKSLPRGRLEALVSAALRLSSLGVVHAGDETFPLRDGIRALALKRMLTDLKPLR